MLEESSTATGNDRTAIARLADIRNHVGQHLGTSDWIQITQDRINAFADATGDHQWIHIDAERARQQSPFPGTIAHGFLVLSLASKFCFEAFSIGDAVMGLNYGLDRVRFPHIVPVNSLLRGHVRLLSVEEIPGGARMKLEVKVELKDVAKPACVAEFISQIYAGS